MLVTVRLSEQLKSARSQLDTLNDEKEHLQERHHIIVEQTRRDLAVKHAECQEYKAKVDAVAELRGRGGGPPRVTVEKG